MAKNKILLCLTVVLAFILRFYQLGSNPPSLYWDEASLGYNAYTISTSLKDEHGEFLPITRFIAFGDYKPPGYIYAAAAGIKLLGLSEFSTRLPSALAGTLLVVVTYFLTKELFQISSFKFRIALLASFLVAISPWSLQMSRGAFEGNFATFFSTFGALLFLKRRWFFSALFFAASMYTFNSHRVFVPLLISALTFIQLKYFWINRKKFLLFCLSFLVFILPLFPYLTTRESRLRFEETSWMKDIAPVELSNNRVLLDQNTILSRIIHNRRIVYGLEFAKHYLDTFNPDFLFFKGDANFRLSTQTVGEVYLIELPFLIIGGYFLIKNKKKAAVILFSWMLLAPIPAAMARETPHALRTLNILPVPQILIALGIVSLLKLKKLKYAVLLIYILFFGFYLKSYFIDYPKNYDSSWQYGYKQAVGYVLANQSKYDQVRVTNFYGRPYIYFLYYSKYPLEKYLRNVNIDRDWYGFWYVHGFDKYIFNDNTPANGKILYVREPGQKPDKSKLLQVIYDLKSKPVFEIWESS